MICIIIILTLLRQYRIDPMSELKEVLIVTYYCHQLEDRLYRGL